MAARCTGAARVVAVDRSAERLTVASRIGATEVIHALLQADLTGLVREACDGPPDCALECTGSIDVVHAAVNSIDMLGTCGLVGGAPAGARITIDHQSLLIGKRIVGIHGGEGHSRELIEAILALHRQGRFPIDLIVHRFQLNEINAALQAASEGCLIKPVLHMMEHREILSSR